MVTELMLIDVLMNNMMERISDPCCTVRMLAVRGLGNIAMGSPEKVQHVCTLTTHFHEILWAQLHLPLTSFSQQVNKYAKELLAAMSSGMEEKDDPGKLTIKSFPMWGKKKS